jgi:DNA-binding MarR family transcriptional regulator
METITGVPKEELLQVEAELLYSLWYDGAASVVRLEQRLGRPSTELLEALEDLIRRGYVYLHWPSLTSPLQSVYYLTTRLRKKIAAMLKETPRYRMKVFWELLCREEEGLPPRDILNAPTV